MGDFYKETQQSSVWKDFADMIDALSTTGGDEQYKRERDDIALHVKSLNQAIPHATDANSLENLETIIGGLKTQTSGNFPALNVLVDVLGDSVQKKKRSYNLYANTLTDTNTQEFINLYDDISQNRSITTDDMINNTTGFWTMDNLTKLVYEYNLIDANIQHGINEGFSSATDVETRTKLTEISKVLNSGIMALATGYHILPSEARLVAMGDVEGIEALTKNKVTYYKNATRVQTTNLNNVNTQIQAVTDKIIAGGQEELAGPYIEEGSAPYMAYQNNYNATVELLEDGELSESLIYEFAANPLSPEIDLDPDSDTYLQIAESDVEYMERLTKDVSSLKLPLYLSQLQKNQLHISSVITDLEKGAKQWGYGGIEGLDVDNYYKDGNAIQRLTNPLYDNNIRTEISYELFDNNATLINELFENGKPNPEHLTVTKGFVEGGQAEFYEYQDSRGQKHYLDKNALDKFSNTFSQNNKKYKSEEFSVKKQILSDVGDLFGGSSESLQLVKNYLYEIENIGFGDERLNEKLVSLSGEGNTFNVKLNEYIIDNLKTAITLNEENIQGNIDNAKTEEERSKAQMLLKLKHYIGINKINIDTIKSIDLEDIRTYLLFGT